MFPQGKQETCYYFYAIYFIFILTVEVVAVLSCHSSCQGQVFSCTPFALGKKCEFEEFCSLHDFVMACQSVLNNALMAVHISSCFTLKLDCSHVVSLLSSQPFLNRFEQQTAPYGSTAKWLFLNAHTFGFYPRIEKLEPPCTA